MAIFYNLMFTSCNKKKDEWLDSKKTERTDTREELDTSALRLVDTKSDK